VSANGSNGNGHHDPDNDFANVDLWERERQEGIAQRRTALRERDRAVLAADDLAEGLTEKLGVDALGLKVSTVEVFGRGRNARVDVHLSDGARPLRFESFSDIARPAILSVELVTQLGVIRSFKAAESAGVAAMIFQLGRHHTESDEDDFAREAGREYLRLAPTQDFDAGDQAERWRAFSALAKLSPARAAGDDRSSAALAQMSLVLVDPAGHRYVRTGWFRDYVKREVGGLYSHSALITQMQRVGWGRPGGEGRIKATSPSDGRSLVWSFYVVDATWEVG
jgi:hypothetical protein